MGKKWLLFCSKQPAVPFKSPNAFELFPRPVFAMAEQLAEPSSSMALALPSNMTDIYQGNEPLSTVALLTGKRI